MGMITLKRPSFKTAGDILIPPSDIRLDCRFFEGGGSRLHDYSLFRNYGIITGPLWTLGRRGYALNFDGINDRVNFSPNPSFNITDKLTVEILVYFKNPPSASTTMFAKAVSASKSWELDFSGPTKRISFSVYDGTVWRSTTYKTDIVIGRWYHIVATYNQSTGEFKAFIDGQLEGTGSSPALAISTTDVTLGCRADGQYVDALIEKAVIYNRVLSQDEIQANYEETK